MGAQISHPGELDGELLAALGVDTGVTQGLVQEDEDPFGRHSVLL